MTKRTTWIATSLLAAMVAVGTVSADGDKKSDTGAEKGKAKAEGKTELTTLEVGTAAPDFTLTDQHGNEVSLSDFAGKTVVLEWTCPSCPFVKRHASEKTMTTLAEKYEGKDVVWLAIDSSNFAKADDLAKWSEESAIDYPILVDANGEVGRMYGAKTTPHMFIVNAEGKVAYEGAIDDSPRGKADETTNYVEAALDAILAGESVATTSTKSYGCSVKYSKGV